MYSYRGHGLSMGIMFAGVDEKGPQLYYMDNDGNRLIGNIFAVGSGGSYAMSVLDTYYKWDLTKEDAIWLAKRAISEATYCDSASGGVVRGRFFLFVKKF